MLLLSRHCAKRLCQPCAGDSSTVIRAFWIRGAVHGRRSYQTTRPTKREQEKAVKQAYPHKGFYAELILSLPVQQSSDPPSLPLSTEPSTGSSQPSAAELQIQSKEVHPVTPSHSQPVQPGYLSTSDQDVPEATWQTINSVAIPPKPAEPENCCMSGCVHCVWDDYSDELESWAVRVAEAKARASSTNQLEDLRQKPREEVDAASKSMDDDGGSSGSSWSAGPSDDLVQSTGEDILEDLPVGVREFMKLERKLKDKGRT